jgi:CheY-like chemotaxis protein/HPt (histidine-containing phosphotransfer) domain-containing protein
LGYQATDIISYQVQSKGLEMLLNISAELPRFIWVDALRLKQVFINLLGNATKFTEKGEIELKIAEISRQDDKTTMRFSVRDTGIGIKPEQQLKIFNAFSQEDASTTKKYGGTGLGLTISNRLLELMGSRLQLESAPGLGSTFYFDITLKTEEGTPIDWENIDLIKRVLIVDDNENNRTILSQMLLLKQIRSVEAGNGFEALQLLARGEHFDVVIMDYHMPGINGLETIQKIRDSFNGREKDLPVILLYSSSDDGAIIKACDELRIKHRLIKPAKMQDIYNTLSRLHIKDKYTASEPKQSEITPVSKNLNILIAEDNAVNMLLAKTILNRILPDAHITGVETGTAAIAACKAHWPDLILMDVQMPEMNGYDATRQIRLIQGERSVPIIALTAGNIKGEREKCIAAGMDDFATKPVVENTLVQLFQQWLPSQKSANTESKKAGNTDPSTHLDLNAIKVLTGDDDNFIKEVLHLTKVELTASLKNIAQQINKGDLNGINLSGHKLNGTALSAGLPALSKIASRFEHIPHFDKDELTQLLVAARDEVTAIFMAIEKHSV